MNRKKKASLVVRMVFIAVLFVFYTVPEIALSQTRIKDITKVKGLINREITGPGLITGLRGTGDGTQAIFTPLIIANYLKVNNIEIDPQSLRTRNSAMVLITGKVPPFAKWGTLIDVTVSSAGDATSLEGGVLATGALLDPLTGQVLAIASGPVSIGGLNVQGAATQNFATTGRIIDGAMVLQDVQTSFTPEENQLELLLNYPDFTTAFRIAEAINDEFGPNTATALDPGTIEVKVEAKADEQNQDISLVEFVSQMEQLLVESDIPAVVTINERTGTVIVGGEVRLSEVIISHGDLTIQIGPPAGAPPGQAAQQAAVVYIDQRTGSSVADLAAALNALQVTPRDLISIFQALKSNGALKATLNIM